MPSHVCLNQHVTELMGAAAPPQSEPGGRKWLDGCARRPAVPGSGEPTRPLRDETSSAITRGGASRRSGWCSLWSGVGPTWEGLAIQAGLGSAFLRGNPPNLSRNQRGTISVSVPCLNLLVVKIDPFPADMFSVHLLLCIVTR